MAYSRAIFNTDTLVVLNMLDPDETINYNWTVDEDYSIVLAEGSIRLHDGTVMTGVNEYRVQPNTNLDATGLGSGRSYFVSIFSVDRDSLMDQIVTEANKTRMRTFAPSWFGDGIPSSPLTSWAGEYTSGSYVYSKDILNAQVSAAEWN